ncbi:putative lectin [Phytophthora cinnamomi]|uniref:putative lectin n=1 Tax=Phytophthora cinnamomi TaxID=4785 RepID=UPI003559BD1D|nr:putative lectin [Phytophthora cinnamomi]
MQIYVLASIALAAVSSVHATDVNGSLANSTSSGSGTHEDVEAGVNSVVTYSTFVGDWEACADDVGCESSSSVCVRHSKYYSQCKPAVLPSGDLCGQSDGTNDWLYDHCPADEKCDAKGTDFRCVKPGTRRRHHHRSSGRKEASSSTAPPALQIGDWEDCSKTGSVCKVSTSTCVKHSNYFSQCMPAVLPTGALCGQNDGTSVWKFDNHCITGETCQAVGTDFHCRSTTTAAPTTAPPATTTPPTVTYVNDWEDCSNASTQCKTTTSVCVKHSNYYSQCMPATLPTGGLCGQADGTSNWMYDHCITGETCKANGKDFHCSK